MDIIIIRGGTDRLSFFSPLIHSLSHSIQVRTFCISCEINEIETKVLAYIYIYNYETIIMNIL